MADRTHAPGRLDVLRAFANTLDLETGEDALASADQAREWCFARDLPPPGADDVDRVRGFREALRSVLLANNGDGEQASAWQAVVPYAREARLILTVSAGSRRPELEAADRGADGTIGALLAIGYSAVADGTWARLKACAKDSCQFAFYDRSKNASGTWCDMAVCGNRAKAQRRRLRDRQNS
ncbi:MAG TPA: CGNR zinc finger domain-containing protein [Candidatus Baltobacteraceae bacterium]